MRQLPALQLSRVLRTSRWAIIRFFHIDMCGNRLKLLKHHADFAAHGVDVLDLIGEFDAVDKDLDPCIVLFEPVDAANQGRLARTRRDRTSTIRSPLCTSRSIFLKCLETSQKTCLPLTMLDSRVWRLSSAHAVPLASRITPQVSFKHPKQLLDARSVKDHVDDRQRDMNTS